MKKIIPTIALFGMLFVGGLSFSPSITHAEPNLKSGLDRVNSEADLSTKSFEELIGQIIRILLGFLGVVFLVLVIYAGFLWMTAAGDPNKVKKAQGLLMQATVGLIIILSAYAISNLVIDAVTTGTRS